MHESGQEIEADRKELRAAFAKVARDAGFRVKGSNALRHRDGAQHRIYFSRSRFADEYSVQLMVRLDRPGDGGEEVLKTWDISGTLGGMLIPRGMLASEADLALYLAATRLSKPAPTEGRGPVLESILRVALPWFDEIGYEAAIRRCISDNDYRIRMGNALGPFYNDFVRRSS